MPDRRRAAVARGLLALALAGGLGGGAGCRRSSSSAASPPPGAPARRVLLVGLDAADWAAIDPLVAAGRLPTFARLLAAGHAATLVSTPPLVSPLIWTTIATGRTADEHGVLDFMVDLPGGGQGPVGSAQRTAPALWNLFSASHRSVAVVGWWATWPAEDVQGTMVSDQLAPQLVRKDPALDTGLVSPAAAAAFLMPLLVRPEQVPLAELQRFAPVTEAQRAAALAPAGGGRFFADRTAHLAAIVAGTRTHVAIAERLLRDPRPDFTAVYLEIVDTVSHRFVADARLGPAAIAQAYVEADAALLRLATAAAPDTWVVVCSDHGFQERTAGIKEDPAALAGPATAWHRPYGIAAAATASALVSGPTAPVSRGGAVVTPLDLAPTVLHAAGLAVEASMHGRAVPELLPPDRAGAAPVRAAYVLPSPARAAGPRAAAIDEAALARLQALGYVGSRPSSQARQNLGEVLYRAGKVDAAERAFRGAAEAQPLALAAWLWLARAQQALGRTPEALASWKQALPLPGGADAALVPALEAAIGAGRDDEARLLVAQAQARGASPAVLHTARAMIASRAPGGAAAAERELRAALRADPSSYDALFRLFELLQRAQRPGDALALVREAARAVPASPRHAALLGETYLAMGDFGRAEPELARALALAPDGVPVRLDLARALVMLRRPEEALATLAPAPSSAPRSILMGAAYAKQERWAEAAATYRDALAAAVPTPEVLNGLGWALHRQGRDPEAKDALRRSLTLRADQPQIRALLDTLGP